jgi:hypothetical protein
MTSRDFAFWLQGFFEVANPISIGSKETEMIKRHLNLVFKHEIDPAMGDEKHQQVLNEIHSGIHIPSSNWPPLNPDKELLRC